jgi:hypothetical protein
MRQCHCFHVLGAWAFIAEMRIMLADIQAAIASMCRFIGGCVKTGSLVSC